MRKKDLTSIKEGLGDLAAQAEMDHEIQMARSELYKIAKYAIKLHEMLKGRSEEQGLEAWQQSKITKAADYMGSVYHNLEYEMKFGAQMAESEKQKGVDGKACWDGYKRMGTKQKGGKTVDNCVKEDSYKDILAQRLDEKSKSKAQQKFMGMVYAAKKGEKPASKDVAKVAKGMSKKAAKDFASTKHKGKPEHVSENTLTEESEVNRVIRGAVEKLGQNPSITDIEKNLNITVKSIRDQLQSRDNDSFIQGIERGLKRFGSSVDYIKRQHLGMTAEKLGLPGLYSIPDGNSFVYVDKDQSGNYQSARFASIEDAVTLYKAGYITRNKAIELQKDNITTAIRNEKHPANGLYGNPGPAADWIKTNPLPDPVGDVIKAQGSGSNTSGAGGASGNTSGAGGASGSAVAPAGSGTPAAGSGAPAAGGGDTAGSGAPAAGGGDLSGQFSRAVAALAKTNNIKNPNLIRVGQTIKLPGNKSYTVAKGDTLSGIASNRFKGTAPK
jgi:hypothetical protein